MPWKKSWVLERQPSWLGLTFLRQRDLHWKAKGNRLKTLSSVPARSPFRVSVTWSCWGSRGVASCASDWLGKSGWFLPPVYSCFLSLTSSVIQRCLDSHLFLCWLEESLERGWKDKAGGVVGHEHEWMSAAVSVRQWEGQVEWRWSQAVWAAKCALYSVGWGPIQVFWILYVSINLIVL